MDELQPRANVDLRDYSTMRLGGTAAYVLDIHEPGQIKQAVLWAAERNLPVLMIGGGSNIFWQDSGFPGLLLVNQIQGYRDEVQADGSHLITIGAGENWDHVVARSVTAGLTGIEALSLIPGTVGGTPVQNVGAYGQEIADTLEWVEAYDAQSADIVRLAKSECDFAYRSSRFKLHDKGRYYITKIGLKLRAGNPTPPFYARLQKYLDEQGTTQYTPQIIRDAVIQLRTKTLPDPEKVANNGSFFANPIVERASADALQAKYPEMPRWDLPDGRVKIPAAWLLEQAGYMDYHDPETGMGTWPAQPLVMVNEHANSTSQLLAFRQKIIDSVRTQFAITLEQEPELLP